MQDIKTDIETNEFFTTIYDKPWAASKKENKTQMFWWKSHTIINTK